MDSPPQRDAVDRALLAHALETAPGAFVAIDAAGRITGWNHASRDLFGWSAEEVLGRPLADTIVPPEHRTDHLAGVERVARSGRSELAGRPLVLPGLTRDGERIPLTVTLWPSDGPEGRRFHAHLRDARPEVASREAAEAQQSRFERLARVVPGVVYTLVLDEDGEARYDYVSPACEALYGFTAEEALADPTLLPGAVHPDDAADHRRATWISGATLEELAWAGRIVHRDGSVRHVSITSRPSLARDGATEWCGVVLEQAAPGAAPQEASDAPAWRAERVTDELRGSLGRRVDEQLDAVRWGLEVAAAAEPDDEVGRALRLVSRAVQRLDTLHRDVWSLVALETGRLVARPARTPVAPHLRAAAALAQEPRRVRVECDPDLTARVQPEHLEQVLANLVSNADEHAGGLTALRATRAGDQVLLDVEDAGDGVPDARRAQLFWKLTRAGDPATAARGTALGLYVVRQLVEANDGAVAHQALDRGSRFVVSLPSG